MTFREDGPPFRASGFNHYKNQSIDQKHIVLHLKGKRSNILLENGCSNAEFSRIRIKIS